MAEMRTHRASAKLRFFSCNFKYINSDERNKHVILNCDIPRQSTRMRSCNWGGSDDGCQTIDSTRFHVIFENKFRDDVQVQNRLQYTCLSITWWQIKRLLQWTRERIKTRQSLPFFSGQVLVVQMVHCKNSSNVGPEWNFIFQQELMGGFWRSSNAIKFLIQIRLLN